MPFVRRSRSRTRERFMAETRIVDHDEGNYRRARTLRGHESSDFTPRERARYEGYRELLRQRNDLRDVYRGMERDARAEYHRATYADSQKKSYYDDATAGLFPRQHYSLMQPASNWEEVGYRLGAVHSS